MEHLPVMYAESLQALNIKADGIYLDCTFGRGGHSRGILESLGDKGKLLAFDKDFDAIHSDYAKVMLEDPRFDLQHGSFAELESAVKARNWEGRVDGVLMDLGVSSPQLDNAERGFSFLRDGDLDMRMNTKAGLSAAQWLAQVDEAELVRVLFEYGEERFARRIANAIVSTRQEAPIVTTLQLAALISNAVPFKEKYKHPATRSFQAIRIAVNQELDDLAAVLAQGMAVLKPSGRLVAISFHSLEDRIVKRFIRNESGRKHNVGKLPIKEADIEQGVLKKVGKAVRAGKEELSLNPRARSAIMRVAERI
ncbi:MAG: 16S rRNA (cytosine(1402)-N(4))-methyltransferase RsmH [Methylococcaceae bacterium]|nr:16S rRNA (cytosine(1402)-N(4))-methyltransferase RsmH [Methylococcaceae bacterium]